MEVSATGYVVLGILNWGPRTGYEIKGVVDKSTRFFWAASYGQIYPELKRLEAAGLVRGRSEPQGGRRRRVYTLTAAGRRELRRWMERAPETYEMRNEGLLKLFLAGAEPPERVIAHLEQMRDQSEELVARLREIDAERPSPGPEAEGFRHLCLRFGIELHEWIAAWCEREERELRSRPSGRRAA